MEEALEYVCMVSISSQSMMNVSNDGFVQKVSIDSGSVPMVFMGILFSQYGAGPKEEKVRAVKETSRPTTPSEVKSFLGLVGFSSRFIPDFATIVELLRALTRNGVKFEWTEVLD